MDELSAGTWNFVCGSKIEFLGRYQCGILTTAEVRWTGSDEMYMNLCGQDTKKNEGI